MPRAVFDRQPLFETEGDSNYRIPTIAVTKNGTIIAACNDRRGSVHDRIPEQWIVVRRSTDGVHWEPIKVLASRPGWACSMQNITYDSEEDSLIIRYDELEFQADGTARPGSVVRYALISMDSGLTWSCQEVTVLPNMHGLYGSAHGSGAGIQLLQGPHKGRLVSCARVSTDHGVTSERRDVLQTKHNNCSVFSDDHGLTWQTGGEVQAGTGEGVVCEFSDGTVYLNSRAYFYDGARRIAFSHDSGETFGAFAVEHQLPEIDFGVNAALVCLQGKGENGQDLCVYTSLDDRKVRRSMTAWISMDSAKTWTRKKRIDDRFCAYSSLAYDATKDLFCMLYEYGEENPYSKGICAARFNLDWLMGV